MADEQVQGVPAGLTAEPIQGVPPGLTAEPVQQAAQDQIQGVPPGLTAEPISQLGGDRYHTPKSLSEEISDKGFLSGIGSWVRDDGSTIIKRQDGQALESQDGGTNWKPYEPKEGDYQIRKGGPIVNLISAGQKPGTITHYNPIVPLPGENFKDTMKRAIDAGKKITPEKLKEDEDQNLMEAPGTLASAVALGATGPVVYGGAKGVSILKQAIVGGDSQILGHPENMMTPEFKKAHPYWSGALETLGGLSTPENASMMIGSGKLNKLPGPAAKIVSRLVQGGFGITLLSSAVKNSPELWDVMQGNGKYADMSEDDREWLAKNLVFHITTSAAMGTQALEEGIAGKSTPLTEFGEKADKLAAQVAQNIASGTQRATSATVSSIGSMLGRTNDFDTAIKRSIKVTPKKMGAHMEKVANVREDLQAILNDNKDTIEDPKTFANAINEHIQSMESDLQKQAGATKNSSEPVVPDITQRLIDRLDKFFEDNKGLYGDESDVSEAKKKILEGILQSRNGEHLLEPNLFEAENVRRRFSRQGQPQFATNAVPTTDAFKAGSLEAASELRKAIDEAYDARGVKLVKESRAKEANLIDVRDSLYSAQDKAEKMGEGSVLQSLMKKIGIPSTVIAIALGHPVGGAAIGAAVLGDQVYQNLTNPNVNVSRAIDLAAQSPGARATVPTRTNSPIHVALASHFGEIIGKSTYNELEGRFMAELEAKAQRNVPLEASEAKIVNMLNDAKAKDAIVQQKLRDDQRKKAPKVVNATLPENYESPMDVGDTRSLHPNMGLQEALIHDMVHIVEGTNRGLKFVDGIRGSMHPELKGTPSYLSAPIDWSDFKDEDGNMDRAKVRAKIKDIAATYLAGGVANELWHGIPLAENKGVGADLNILKNKILKEIGGYSEAEASKIINQAVDSLRESLSQPNVREILEQHAQVREPGLDNQHHFSEDRMKQVVKDIQGATNANEGSRNAPGTPGTLRPGSTEAVPGGKEGREAGTPSEPGAEHKAPGKIGKRLADIESVDWPRPIIEPKEPKLGAAEDDELKKTYQVVDKNGNVISEHTTSKGARRRVDKLDSEYGAAVHGVREKAAPESPKLAAAEEPKKEDEYVYHATDKSRAEAIKQQGIRAKSWYAKTPEEALRSGVTPISGKREDLRVFRVPKVEIEPVKPDVADIGAREVEKGRFVMSGKPHAAEEVDAQGQLIGKGVQYARFDNGTVGGEGTPGREADVPGREAAGPEAPRGAVGQPAGITPESPKLGKIVVPEDHQGSESDVIKNGGWFLPDGQNYVHDAKETHGVAALNMGFTGSEPYQAQPTALSARLDALNKGAIRATLGGKTGTTTLEVFGITDKSKPRLLDALNAAPADKPVYLAYGKGDPKLSPKEFANPEEAIDWIDRRIPESPKLGIPPERTVGDPEHDRVIREGGGIPGGVLGNLGDENHVKMFHDPQTGTTLGLAGKDAVTVEAVRAKIAASRAEYAAGEQRKAAREAAAKESLPPQPRLPDTGTYPAIKTDDGGIYFDSKPEGRTHIMFAKEQGIPPERIISGGWLKDGEYEGSERSDAGRWGEQARAKIRSESSKHAGLAALGKKP